MIYVLNIILILDLAKSQIEVDLSEKNKWTNIFDTLSNVTFKVTSLQNEYCYVRIELYTKDPTFLVMAEYKSKPKASLISTYKQGEKIDRISQLENRGTRFLKLKGKAGTIFITTMADQTNNSYNITITGNDNVQCDNDCFQKGICEPDGCKCYSQYIGNDCHQLTEELSTGTQKDVDIFYDETIKFFSIDLYYQLGQMLKLEFQSDCQDCLNIVIYKTKALLMSNEITNYNYTSVFYITDGYNIIQAIIPDILPSSQQILYFAVLKASPYTTHLKIKCNYDNFQFDDEDSDSARLIYIIIPSIVGSLIFFLFIGCLLKRRKNYMNQTNQVAQDPFYQQTRNGVAQDPFSQQNRNVLGFNILQQQQYQQPQREIIQYPGTQQLWQKEENQNDENEKCVICLSQLKDYNQPIKKINCGHQFHKKCIQEWCLKQISQRQDKQSDCPYCRQPMNINEIL